MSQRGSATHSASRLTSQSPPRDAVSSSPLQQRNPAHQDGTNKRQPHDPGGMTGGMPLTEGEDRGDRRCGSRASGVHNILNPPGPSMPLPEPSPPAPRPSGEASPTVKMEPALYGGNDTPSRLAGNPSQQHTLHATPPGQPPAVPLPPGSPTGMHPYPLAAARRILTPKSPRAASLSRAAMRQVEAHRLSILPPGVPRGVSGGGPAHEASPLGGPPALGTSPQFPGPILGPGPMGSLPPSRPTSGLSRSLSQPMMSHGMPTTSSQEPPPSGSVSREHGRRSLYSPGLPFATPAPPNRPVLGDTRWAAGVVGQLPPSGSVVRTLQLGDGQQHMLAITPTHGEEILIPVDFHQGSKQADEKRQRNAGASARFRQRKKEREKEQQQGLQKLESQNRELERRIEELEKRNLDLEAEREFYRGERNRLRDLVGRTPGISEWADRGPPSPTPSRSAGSYAVDNSPLPAPAPLVPPPHPHAHAHPYTHSHTHALAHPHPPPSSYDDPSMHERPARRRRTDSEPQLGSQSYRPTTPASLPPLPGVPLGYAIPHSPRLATSPGTAPRLPPIRFDHSHPTSETPPPLQTGPPPPPAAPPSIGQAGAYPSHSKAPYETGWATMPRGPTEGGSR